MRTFALYIQDRRYSTPTLRFVTVKDEAQARELAGQELVVSADHLAVELYDEGSRLFRQERA